MAKFTYQETEISDFDTYIDTLRVVDNQEDFDTLRMNLKAIANTADRIIQVMIPERLEQFIEWGLPSEDFEITPEEARDVFDYSIGGIDPNEVDRLMWALKATSPKARPEEIHTYLEESQWVMMYGPKFYSFDLELELSPEEALAKQIECDRGILAAYHIADRFRHYDQARTSAQSFERDYDELHTILDSKSSRTTRTIQVVLPEGVQIDGEAEITIETV